MKYISGKSKLTPQTGLSSDRYRYLALSDAEPNLGNPTIGPSSEGVKVPPPGQQFDLVAVANNYDNNNRYWLPRGGGLIPGSITIYEESSQVGGFSSTTQLDFKGLAITATGDSPFDPNPSPLVTITVAPPGNDTEILFVNSGVTTDFDTDSRFTFDDGLLSAGDRIIVGTGGTVITTTGIGSVGIGTTDPTQELHLVGDFRITGTIYDSTNDPGTTSDILVKTADGGLLWVTQSSIVSGAGGTIGQIQFHNTAGLVDGADNFYFDFNNNRVGIGSTQPTQTLDVLGISTFVGGVFIDDLYVSGLSTFTGAIDANGDLDVDGLTNLDNVNITGFSTFGNDLDINASIDVDGHTELDDLNVTGISTFGGNVDINASVDIQDDLVVGGGLDVTGISTFRNNVDLGDNTSDTVTFGGRVDSSIVPSQNLTYDLGSLSLRWNNVYAQTFDGLFIGNADSATQVSTGTTTGTDEYYLTFVDSNNTNRDNELLYTDEGIVYNPNTNQLGIGTDNPTQKLEVLGSTLLKGTSSTATALNIRGAGTQGDDATISFTNGYTQTFKIGMSDDIGPARDFIISETSTGSSSDNENPKYIFNGNGDGIFQITDRAGGDVNVQLATSGISYLNGGNVGIGTDAPSQTLDVNGNARFRGAIYDSGNGAGTSGQVLSSTVTGVDWIDQSGNDIDVVQYADEGTPRTEYGCSNPISVTTSVGISTIGIGSTSNAYGKRYVQETEPTTDVCDGDIWYDTSTLGVAGGFTLEAVDSGSNAILRLSDGLTNDDVLITAGSNITIDPVAAGGFTISAVDGAGVGIAASASDVLNVNGGEIGGVDPGADRIVFWDDTAGKLTYLTAGTGLDITGTTITANEDAGKTYTLEAVDSGSNAILRLSDGSTNDDVTITAGSNITIDPVAAGGFTISAAGGFVTGMIMMYTGSTAPSGWALCDGQNGTPDLRDRFIISTGSTYSSGNTGGSADAIVVSHTHTVTDPGHTHTYSRAQDEANGYAEVGTSQERLTLNVSYANQTTVSNTTGISINSQGSSGTNANLPPYYALAFIMKL